MDGGREQTCVEFQTLRDDGLTEREIGRGGAVY